MSFKSHLTPTLVAFLLFGHVCAAFPVANIPGSLTVLDDGYSRADGQPFITSQVLAGSGPSNQLQFAKTTPFVAFDANFSRLLGPDPGLRDLAEFIAPFAHDGSVYLPSTNEVRPCIDAASFNEGIE